MTISSSLEGSTTLYTQVSQHNSLIAFDWVYSYPPHHNSSISRMDQMLLQQLQQEQEQEQQQQEQAGTTAAATTTTMGGSNNSDSHNHSYCSIIESYLDNLPAYAYIKDVEGNYIYLNNWTERLYNIKRTELGRVRQYTDYDFFCTEDADRVKAMDKLVMETGERASVKHYLAKGLFDGDGGGDVVNNNDDDDDDSDRKKRSEYLYMTVKFPLRNATGEIVGVCGISHDVTTQNETETTTHRAELKKSENRFRSLFQHIQNALALHEIVTDDETGEAIDYVFVDVNEAFAEMVGLPVENIVGRRATEVFPHGHAMMGKDRIDLYGTVAQQGAVEQFKEYSESVAKWHMGLAFRPQENEFVTLFIDITERMEIEEALQQSEERHRTLFESMIQGVVYQDAVGNIIGANPSAERILGLTIDQMMGRTSVHPEWKSIHEDGSDYPGNTHPSMVALETGNPVTGAIMGVYHPTDGTHHWITIDSVPLFKPNDPKPFQVFTTFTDVTDQKNFERAMLRAKEKAEEADKLKSAFLANMSHEIRTPLNGIMGHIDLALSNNLSEECRGENKEGLEVSRESGHLLVSIINDILDLSKIEAGQMDISKQAFPVRRMVDQTMKVGNMLVNQRKKSITLSQEVDPTISNCICGDNFRLQQIVNNLVSNAVKFTETGGVDLRVRLQPDGKMLQFSVEDSGRGISEDQLEVVFEPFRQADYSDTRKFGGTGLGLTISRKLIELMGGKLWVDSTVGVGSTFFFTLPYEIAPEDGTAESVEPTETVATLSNASGKILIAEDDPVSRKVAAKMVEKAGYDVVLACNGAMAVSKFESDSTIDLILMDVNMDVMGGLEATTRIRGLEAKTQSERRIPIIALSAAAMTGDRERGASAGMTDYLTKPVNRKELVKTLEKYLGKLKNGGVKRKADYTNHITTDRACSTVEVSIELNGKPVKIEMAA